MLAIEGIQTSEFSDLFGKRGMEFLKGVKLRQVRREALDNYLEVLKALEERIEEMETILKERAKITDEAKEVADEHPRHMIYNKIKARRGEKVAIVAIARHMAESVYWVLTRKEYYKENRAIRASSFS